VKLKRKEFQKLKTWYESPLQKTPCVLFGARQVGKSTLASDFAESTGRDVISVNFWKDPDGSLKKIFTKNTSATQILSQLEIHYERRIHPKECILVLDEIQECPSAYALCKSFKEDSEIPVLATGSYLKLLLLSEVDKTIPVGCTHEILVTPLGFQEFLRNKNEFLYEKLTSADLEEEVPGVLHEKLLRAYREYLFTGGMPEALSLYLEAEKESQQEAASLAREVHKSLLNGYRQDFLEFSRKNWFKSRTKIVEKLLITFDAIPKELAKYHDSDTPTQRFRFNSLGKNAEYRRLANVFEYLVNAGLIIKSHVIKDPSFPLMNEDSDKSAFKCFFFDVGLLNAALKIPFKKIIQDDLSHYKGPMAENFVAQQLFSKTGEDLYSWKPNSSQEVEFLALKDSEVIPIEVKASKKSSESPSLDKYIQEHSPRMAVKVAPRNFGRHDSKVSLPIYFIEKWLESSE
jgi:uncharacterized protein